MSRSIPGKQRDGVVGAFQAEGTIYVTPHIEKSCLGVFRKE